MDGICALIGFAIFLSFLLIDEMLLGGWLLEDIFMNNTDRRESLITAIIFRGVSFRSSCSPWAAVPVTTTVDSQHRLTVRVKSYGKKSKSSLTRETDKCVSPPLS